MENEKVYVKCEKCQALQEYRGQYYCDVCKTRFSTFTLVCQLRAFFKGRKS